MTNELKCKTCVPPERHPGCHATCKYYIEWNEQHQKELKEKHKRKWLEGIARPEKPKRRRKK